MSLSEVCRKSGAPIEGEQTTISEPVVARIPRRNIKEFWLTILSEAERSQIQCLSPKGEFWVCSEANSRMLQDSFQ